MTLGYVVLSTQWGAAVFLALGRGAEGFLAFSYEGSDFVFSAQLSSTVSKPVETGLFRIDYLNPKPQTPNPKPQTPNSKPILGP